MEKSDFQQYNQNDLTDCLRKIKQSFRLIMNGSVAQSMREKGVYYKLNWGASIIDLQNMATEIRENGCQDDHDSTADRQPLTVQELAVLSEMLWQQNVRECRLLATMLMPHSCFSPIQAKQWIASLNTNEEAEALSHYLLQHTKGTYPTIISLIETAKGYPLLCSLHTLNKLFGKQQIDISENLLTALHNIASDTTHSLSIRKAAISIIYNYSENDIS